MMVVKILIVQYNRKGDKNSKGVGSIEETKVVDSCNGGSLPVTVAWRLWKRYQ